MIDYQALRDEILSSVRASNYSQLAVTPDMPKQNAYLKDNAIADLLNSPTGTMLVEARENAVELMSKLGALTAANIFTKLEAAQTNLPFLKWAMAALNSDRGINFGDHEMQTILDSLASGGILTQSESNMLKELGTKPSSIAYQIIGKPVTWEDVSIALRGDANFSIGG